MKRCFKCQCDKPADDFYRHPKMKDGRLGKCKECTKTDVKRHRQENLEVIRSYDRKRGNVPHRVAARKDYAKTPEGRLSHAKAMTSYKERFPERDWARTTLSNAVRDGKVSPWPVCAVPDCCVKPEGHHPDYSRPLDVVWLCGKHHREVHAMAR